MHSDYSTPGNVLPYRVRSRECHTSVTLPSFMQSYITHVSFLLSVTAISTSFPAPFYEAITVPLHVFYDVSEHLFVLALEQRCAESAVTLSSAWVSEIAYSFMGAALLALWPRWRAGVERSAASTLWCKRQQLVHFNICLNEFQSVSSNHSRAGQFCLGGVVDL